MGKSGQDWEASARVESSVAAAAAAAAAGSKKLASFSKQQEAGAVRPTQDTTKAFFRQQFGATYHDGVVELGVCDNIIERPLDNNRSKKRMARALGRVKRRDR